MTSLVFFHIQGVPRPPVQATVECDIGFKRSADGCARTPSRDWSSSSLALPIVGEPYGCHALQRLQACTAFPNMLLFPLAFAARLVGSSGTPPWFLLSATGISQSASRRTPDRHLSAHPALQAWNVVCLDRLSPCGSRPPAHDRGRFHSPAALRPVLSVTPGIRLLWPLCHHEPLGF